MPGECFIGFVPAFHLDRRSIDRRAFAERGSGHLTWGGKRSHVVVVDAHYVELSVFLLDERHQSVRAAVDVTVAHPPQMLAAYFELQRVEQRAGGRMVFRRIWLDGRSGGEN